MKTFPKLRKDIKRFVRDERGTITKESIIKMGVGLSMLAILAADVSAHHVSSAVHSNTITLVDNEGSVQTEHSHAVSHGQAC